MELNWIATHHKHYDSYSAIKEVDHKLKNIFSLSYVYNFCVHKNLRGDLHFIRFWIDVRIETQKPYISLNQVTVYSVEYTGNSKYDESNVRDILRKIEQNKFDSLMLFSKEGD